MTDWCFIPFPPLKSTLAPGKIRCSSTASIAKRKGTPRARLFGPAYFYDDEYLVKVYRMACAQRRFFTTFAGTRLALLPLNFACFVPFEEPAGALPFASFFAAGFA